MGLLRGEFNNEDLSLYGYGEDTELELNGSTNSKELNIIGNLGDLSDNCDYLYGKLNKEVEKQEYVGTSTDTIQVIVNNTDDTIKANFKKTKGKLNIFTGEGRFEFDGSKDINVDISDIGHYVTEEELDKHLDLVNAKIDKEIEDRIASYEQLNLIIQQQIDDLRTEINDSIKVEIDELRTEINDNIKVEIDNIKVDLAEEIEERKEADNKLKANVDAINELIPNQTTPENQLADKNFVNSSINSISANYITYNANGDPFPSKEALLSGPYYYQGKITILSKNDYALVNNDETYDNAAVRYHYDGEQWDFQYKVNDTPFTAAQLAAINSGITAEILEDLRTKANQAELNIQDLYDKLPRVYRLI